MDWFGGLEFEYQYVVEQAEALGTVGDWQNSPQTVTVSNAEEVWDPLAGIFG